jgi:glutamate synthase domain-containing protein 2
VLNNLARNPYAAALSIDGEDGGTGAAYNVLMDKMGHLSQPICESAISTLSSRANRMNCL